MIYCVIPRAMTDELGPKLLDYYADDVHVTVIVDRRQFDRRARHGRSTAPATDAGQRRVVRDRRRARMPGDLPSLARVS
jgi:hypothetical protein